MFLTKGLDGHPDLPRLLVGLEQVDELSAEAIGAAAGEPA